MTKIIANGLQGLMFSVLWKLIDDKYFKNKNNINITQDKKELEKEL